MGNISELSAETLRRCFEQLNNGEKLLSACPVTAGMENTTYFIQSESGDTYYFTLFEHLSLGKVAEYNKLLRRLHQLGLPVPLAISRTDGCVTGQGFYPEGAQKTKPWIICPAIPGSSPVEIRPVHCMEIGRFLGQLHQVKEYRLDLNAGMPWAETLDRLRQNLQHLTRKEFQWCQDKLNRIESLEQQVDSLPWSVGHGDLFPDNALFLDARLSGVIDFFNAYHGPRIFDLAVVVNAWCSEGQGQLNQKKAVTLLSAYQGCVTLTAFERQQFPHWLFFAGFRFWASRWLWQYQYAGQVADLKDPSEYAMIVESRLNNQGSLVQLVGDAVINKQ